MEANQQGREKRVIIVGDGFGGVAAAKQLKHAPARVGLIDRRNHHLFQPLLYQVATAALSPSDIASPIRKIFRHQENVSSVLGEVDSVDLNDQTVTVKGQRISYDYLVLAAGATHSYFGNDTWAKHAPGLKTIEDATEIRRRFLLAFEAAELETDPEARRALLTFVVVGAGPTGCELAGAMAEIAHNVIPADFRRVDTTTARILLVQSGDRILKAMPESSSASAHRQLEELGVKILLGQRVTDITPDGVKCGDEFIPANNTFWAAGVKASPLGESLGTELDRAGRVVVNPDLSIPGHPNAFVIGDQAATIDSATGKPVPGVAQGAIQGGDHVGRIICRELTAARDGNPPPQRENFRYLDKGSLATIGRNRAVADIHGHKLSGFPAWIVWAVVHVLFLVSFRSRLAVGLSWCWSYLFGDRGARLITGDSAMRIKRPPELG